jgi:endonuclease YncB( thermonuclease family)
MYQMNSFLPLYLSLILLFSGLPFSAPLADNAPTPVPDKLLKTLGLDRAYHKCLSVADGDTLTLEGLGTVRFIGVDTSEKNHPMLPVQFMAKEAGAFTERICLGKKIRLEYDSHDEDKRGNYGRVLGYAYLEDGTFLQEELIKKGYAIAYTKYPLDENRKRLFLDWQKEAQTRGRGLWKDNGLSEVLWILAQKQPLIEICKASKDRWEIGFGNWRLKQVHHGDIESHLTKLYSAIYEFSPRELRAKLSELQYLEEPSLINNRKPIFIIGMAHKKWGIIYENHTLPRLLSERLDDEVHNLADWIADYDGKALVKVLLKNQYRRIPERSIYYFEPKKIAKTFLAVYEVKSIGEGTIPWDLAARYIGKHVSVQGKITRTHNSGKACFLNFHNNWTRYFSLVIFDNVFHRFPEKPEKFYLDKYVRVSGKIKIFRGRPEMVLNRSQQIEIIANP